MSESDWQGTASSDVLLERALMLKSIRAFFDAAGVIEVETPLLSHASTTDVHLDSLQSQFRGQTCYLNTSPEYAMKRILVTWNKPIYQICKAFRDDELGRFHNPEFTMLEWYQPGYDEVKLMDEVEKLIQTLVGLSSNKYLSDSPLSGVAALNFSFQRLSYQQAFEATVGINPHRTSASECHQAAVKNNVQIPQGMLIDDDELNDWLDWLLTQLVLPSFKKDSFTFLYDYPVAQCALAKIALNPQQVPVAKRFELFFGEIELANGFYELTDSAEQLSRFQEDNQKRARAGKPAGCIDENFIAALNHGLPECSGVALGLDRLLMVLSACVSIEKVISFPWNSA